MKETPNESIDKKKNGKLDFGFAFRFIVPLCLKTVFFFSKMKRKRRFSDESSDSSENNVENRFDRIEVIQKHSENRFEVRCFCDSTGTSFRGK